MFDVNKDRIPLTIERNVGVVTICSLRHADVWKLTSRLLPQFLEANKYYVYVPHSEVTEFKKITNSKIQVMSQDILGKDYFQALSDKVSFCKNEKRFGWYLQQFFKIEALVNLDHTHLVIWDADCVPLTKMNMFDNSGNPNYMLASQEYHKTYFDTIFKLLKISKLQSFSFVIPGFPILKTWVSEFIEEIELRNKSTWHQSIIDCTPFSEASGFSETETLGTWISNRHPESWLTFPLTWERFGQKRFGYARDFDEKSIVRLGKRHHLDIITFENWDKPRMLIRLKNMITR